MIDLHTHSTFSDGTLTPTELIEKARRKGLTAIALTDHDTLGGLKEGEEAAVNNGIKFVRGVELSINCKKGELHLLGLDIGENTAEMEKILVEIRIFRQNRNLEMIEKMNKTGFPTTIEEIEEIAGGEVLGRPHLAQHLVNLKVCKSIKEAFRVHLRKGGLLYIPKMKLDLTPAVELIINADGIPVIAHPLSTRYKLTDLDDIVRHWKEIGISGLESVHPSIKRGKTRQLEELAEKHGLLCSAGSDFHGGNRPGVRLGRTGWGSKIPDSYLKILRSGKLF